VEPFRFTWEDRAFLIYVIANRDDVSDVLAGEFVVTPGQQTLSKHLIPARLFAEKVETDWPAPCKAHSLDT
jgi:hypothetical protein